MKVSVITATNKLNQLDYLIDNFKKQTLKHKELIVVLNDDLFELEKIKNKYKEENIKFIQIPEKENLSYCLNRGVETSTGEYIAIMDDDDAYSVDYLKNALLNHLRYKADVSGVCEHYMYIPEIDYFGLFHKGLEHKIFKNRGYLIGGSILYNKSVWDKIKYKEEEKYINGTCDVYFINQAIQHGFTVYSRKKDDFVYIRDSQKHSFNRDYSHFMEQTIRMDIPDCVKCFLKKNIKNNQE